jgi:hypothetical protein
MQKIDSTVERGETVVQVVIAVPIVLSILLIAIQAMLFMHSAQHCPGFKHGNNYCS